MTATLTSSLEDYLEAIFHIISEKRAARPKDIARRLNVANSSVTGALRALSEKNLVEYSPYDVVFLTEEGAGIAKDVIRRHEVLRDFFVKVLYIDEKTADEAACQMEHGIPKEVVERLVAFAEYVETCPRGNAKWIEGFGYRCDSHGEGSAGDSCSQHRAKTGIQLTDPEERHPIKLKDLKPGQKARIVNIAVKGDTRKRIVEMGVTRGSLVEVERVAPLGDPIDVKVRGYHLSLRKSEAGSIDVEIV